MGRLPTVGYANGWIGFLELPTVRSANDMGVYYHPEQPAIVPDGFLALGVERFYDEELRPSYVLWEEQVVPSLVMEVVSITPGQEYTSKYSSIQVLTFV